MWTTTLEPRQAVKALGSPQSIDSKGILFGRLEWSASDNDQVDDARESGRFSLALRDIGLPRHEFNGQLFVSCTRQGQFNKVSWIEYSSQQILDPENTRTFISKAHLKPFLFSKVKSWRGYC